jgi:hypothetical protein
VSLQGALEVFGLPDIFGLLGSTAKTGALRVTGPGGEGVVYFRDGAVVSASSDVHVQGLARRIVGAGRVGDEALAAAVNRVQSEHGVGVARALYEAGAVDHETLRNLAAEHAIDAVFDLLRWSEGVFSFTVDAAGEDRLDLALTVEAVVGEARRRLEDWGRVRELVPSVDALVCLAVTPPDDPTLRLEEWPLLALVDGRRSVADIVALTGRGEYAVCCTLAGLVERGLVVVGQDPNGGGAADLLRRQAMLGALERSNGPAPVAAAEPPRVEPAATAATAPDAVRGGPPDGVRHSPVPARPSGPARRPLHPAAGMTGNGAGGRAEQGGRPDKATLLRLINALERMP